MVSWFLTWEVWASMAAGLTVSGCVLIAARLMRYFRRGRLAGFEDADVPWDDLVDMLRSHNEGKPASEHLTEEQLLQSLLDDARSASDSGSGSWVSTTPTDRRRSRRRWLNPIEVVVLSPFHEQPLHGLVVNRSVGGLAILADYDFAPETVLRIRPTDAPPGVGYIDVCVRHTKSASRLFVIGCQYKGEVPWNVKVWFG